MDRALVFPTPVGMNRPGAHPDRSRTRVPHTRGDEPPFRSTVTPATMCSPHPWG